MKFKLSNSVLLNTCFYQWVIITKFIYIITFYDNNSASNTNFRTRKKNGFIFKSFI